MVPDLMRWFQSALRIAALQHQILIKINIFLHFDSKIAYPLRKMSVYESLPASDPAISDSISAFLRSLLATSLSFDFTKLKVEGFKMRG